MNLYATIPQVFSVGNKSFQHFFQTRFLKQCKWVPFLFDQTQLTSHRSYLHICWIFFPDTNCPFVFLLLVPSLGLFSLPSALLGGLTAKPPQLPPAPPALLGPLCFSCVFCRPSGQSHFSALGQLKMVSTSLTAS